MPRAVWLRLMAKPTATLVTAAAARATATRRARWPPMHTAGWRPRSHRSTLSTASASTAPGEGRNRAGTTSRLAASHRRAISTRNVAMAVPTMRVGREKRTAAPRPGGRRQIRRGCGRPAHAAVSRAGDGEDQRLTRSRVVGKRGSALRASGPRRRRSGARNRADRGDDGPGSRRHHQEAARQEYRLLDAVGDEEDALARPAPDVEDQLLHLLAGQGVEGAERLVHQEEVGTAVSARATPTRWRMPPESCQMRRVSTPSRPTSRSMARRARAARPRHAAQAEAEGDIVDDVEPGQQRAVLEHHAAVGARARDGVPVEAHGAAGRARGSRPSG